MAEQTQTFDRVADSYDRYLDSMRGWVREHVVRANLVGTLAVLSQLAPDESLQVLDFGGGNARDALWLAEMGHSVTIVDLAATQIAKGRAYIAERADAETAARITFTQGGVEEVKALQPESFHLALSHGVLQYELDNPAAQVRAIATVLRNRGSLSLLNEGYLSAERKVLQAIRDPEDDTSLDALDMFRRTAVYHNHLDGTPARAYELAELKNLVRENGFHIAAHTFGVRLLTDGDERLHETVPDAEKKMILEMEVAESRKLERLAAASMIHVIALKIDTSDLQARRAGR